MSKKNRAQNKHTRVLVFGGRLGNGAVSLRPVVTPVALRHTGAKCATLQTQLSAPAFVLNCKSCSDHCICDLGYTLVANATIVMYHPSVGWHNLQQYNNLADLALRSYVFNNSLEKYSI